MSFAAKFGFDVEGVGAIEVDVVVLRGCQVFGGRVGDRVAVGAQSVEGVAKVGGGPERRGVGDEGEAQRLVDLVVEVPSPDVALMGEEQVAAQSVQALALVELATDSAAEFLVRDVPISYVESRRGSVVRPSVSPRAEGPCSLCR
jgi:hypothetical protein